MTSRRSLVLLVLLAGLFASACASTGPALEIGFRRIALDLAFKDEELAAPVPAPQIITQIIPAPDVVFDPVEPRRVQVVRIIPRAESDECIPAPEGLAPLRAAFPVVKAPPTAGVYRRHNEGGVTIEAATQSFDVPLPPETKWEITEPTELTAIPATGSVMDPVRGTGETGEPTKPMTEFSITRYLSRNSWVTDTYRYTNEQPDPTSASTNATGDFLYLVKRVRVFQGEESVFNPTPPIRMVKLNVPEGPIQESGVVHGGVDRESNVAMTVTSQILDRELVDVCGEVFDTYRVEIKEQFVDLAKSPPETSGNEGTDANYWNIQFDNGLLILREEVHTTLRTTTEILGQEVPVTVRYDYTSTLADPEPEPLPEPAPAEAAAEDAG